MFVRIARFEGGRADAIVREAERLREDLGTLRGGGTMPSMPSELVHNVSRMEVAVDREHGAVTMSVYSETRDQIRTADRLLESMSPGEGWGRRVSVGVYEILLDEQPGVREQAA